MVLTGSSPPPSGLPWRNAPPTRRCETSPTCWSAACCANWKAAGEAQATSWPCPLYRFSTFPRRGRSKASNNVLLNQSRALHQPLRRQRQQVQAAVTALGDPFGQAAPYSGRLLQPMTAESIGQQQVGQMRVRPQQRIVVVRVVFV